MEASASGLSLSLSLCARMILQFPATDVFIDTFAPSEKTSPLNKLDLDHEDLNW